MMAEKDFAGRQIRGNRARQEDAYAFSEIVGSDGRVQGLLAVVADGLGGHPSGERASELALETFIEEFHAGAKCLHERLLRGATAANEAIARALDPARGLHGMGTTLVAVAVTRDGVEWISIGDSPLYLWRNGKLRRLNADHSFRPLLRDLIESGKLTEEKAAKHPHRNLLRSALTGDPIELIDSPDAPLALQNGDRILAATDGVQTLTDDEIARIVSSTREVSAAGTVSGILRAVLCAGKPKQDNTTVAIIHFALDAFTAQQPVEASNAGADVETIVTQPGTSRT